MTNWFKKTWAWIKDKWSKTRKWLKALFWVSAVSAASLTGAPLLEQEPITIDRATIQAKFQDATAFKDKYVMEGASLKRNLVKNAELTRRGEAKDKIEVRLGNETDDKFTPTIEMKRWEETQFRLIPPADASKDNKKSLSFVGDKAVFETPKMKYEMYEVGDDFKYVWYLNEPPPTNKIEFGIESSGLDFLYQPPLNEEYPDSQNCSPTECDTDGDGELDSFRPENVVGSYAVYHQTKGKMNDIGGKDYKTGKAFHIYRPHIIDATGTEAWGNLHIENGIYSVEIPQEFLDTAVYPIKSNDTFGFETAGASNSTIENQILLGRYAPSSSGTGVSITAYVQNDWQSASRNTKANVYQDETGQTDVDVALLANGTTEQVALATSFLGWKTYNFSSAPTFVSGTYYRLAIWAASAGGSSLVFWDSTGTHGWYYKTATYGTWPDPSGTLTNDTNDLSIYATYVPNIDPNYVSRRPIVIDKDLVASSTGETYTSFPFLVSETEDYLKATSSGGTIQHAAGWDIEFTAGSSATSTKLYHQIDTYEPTTGKLAAWVSLPTLSTSTDTTIYMWYNNSSVTASTEDPLEVWTTNYTWVHHLTGTTDSSANSRNLSNLAGVPTATSTGGQIGGAYIYDGNDAHYNSTDYLSYFSTSVATIEAWVKQTGTPPTVSPSLWSGDPIISNLDAEIGLGSWNNAGGNKFGALNYDGNADYVHATSTNDVWTHLVFVHTGGNVYLYQDGVSMGSAASGNTTDEASTSYLLLAGSPSGGGQYFVGSIDEVRVSNVARSADWINTEWCNQAGSGTCAFYALGADELAEEGGATPASYYIIDID